MQISKSEILTYIKDLSIEQRDYQIDAVKKIIESYPQSSVLLNYPYGTGKTIISLISMLILKKHNPDKKIIFTSAREAAALRCRQALEMAKKFGFIEKLGYLFDPMGKGLSARQKYKMYVMSSVVFSPITRLMNDYFDIKRKVYKDIISNTTLLVIDEATDILARDVGGFRLSKYFQGIFNLIEKKGNIPVLALSGTRDKEKVHSILRTLGKQTILIQREDISPYETQTIIQKIKRKDYSKIDQTISSQISNPINTIQKIWDKNHLSNLDIIKMSYSGIIEKLRTTKIFPTTVNRFEIKSTQDKQTLINSFLRIFKYSHARLLLLDSTPGEFLKYIELEENRETFREIIPLTQELVAYRVSLPFFDNPDETTTRGLVQPKIYTSIKIIYEHLIKGAKIIAFTRYIALADQLYNLLKKLRFPYISYLSGKTPEDTRKNILRKFDEGNINVLIFTPLGGRGLNLEQADVVIQLDITSNIDDMYQRRERARGCLEYVLVLEETTEEGKVKEYQEMTSKSKQNSET